MEATGTLDARRINDTWEVLLDACVDDGCEYASREGSWGSVRQWILDELGTEYLSQKQVEQVISQTESTTA